MLHSKQWTSGIAMAVILHVADWAFPIAMASAGESANGDTVSTEKPKPDTRHADEQATDLATVPPLPMPMPDSRNPPEMPEPIPSAPPASSDAQEPNAPVK